MKKGTNTKVASVPLDQPTKREMIAIAGGLSKANATRAALKGQLISGLITDESVAKEILK